MDRQGQPSLVERAVLPAIVVSALLIAGALLWPFVASPGSPTYVDVGEWLSGVVQPIAAFWFVAAFLLQHEELKLQRIELALTRDELRRQADAASSSDLTAKRAVFVSLRSEYQGLMDDALKPLVDKLKQVPFAWQSSTEHPIVLTASSLSSILANPDDPKFQTSDVIRFLRSQEFRASRDQFVRAMNGLLDLAGACGPDEVLVSRVRSTPHFAWYVFLQREFDHGDCHPLAQGNRSTDMTLRRLDEIRVWT